jgi:hypothetical protein
MTERVKNIIILGAGCIFLLCVWLFSSPNSEFSNPPMETAEYYQPAPTPGSDLDWIEADSEIKIPSNAREIYARISGFRELDVWVRFDLPDKDLSSFLKSTLCELPLSQVSPKNYAPDELAPDWWQPHISKNLAECRGGNSTTRQNILIDGTNSKTLKIYVFSWTDNFATSTPSE